MGSRVYQIKSFRRAGVCSNSTYVPCLFALLCQFVRTMGLEVKKPLTPYKYTTFALSKVFYCCRFFQHSELAFCNSKVSALEWHSSFPNYPHQEPEENWETTYMYTLDDVLDNLTDIMLVNSVNGFVCFWSYNARFHICNPMTKEYFATPPYSHVICPAAVGFGFCQLSYQYKVILLHDAAAALDYAEIKPLVFTVGTDCSWRSLKAISDRRFLSRIEKGAHVKGVLYWYLESYTDLKGRPLDCTKTIKSLVCFDVSKEEVATIMVPAELDSQEEGGRYVTRTAEKGGNLCLINISYGPIYSLLIKIYIAQSTSADLGSLNSWKK